MKRLAACILACASTMSACENPQVSGELTLSSDYAVAAGKFSKVYLITAGDSLDVLVRGNADVSRSVIVRPDGFISLPLLGDVHAAGLSIPQLSSAVRELYAKRLVEPEVTVIATNVRQSMVYVLGEVSRPQAVPHKVASTAAQAIAYSGGFSLTASKQAVAVIRLTDDGRLRAYVVPVELKGQPAPYMALQAMLLQPEDIVFVPASDIAQVDRFIDDYINRPLSGLNSVLSPIANFLLIQDLIDENNF